MNTTLSASRSALHRVCDLQPQPMTWLWPFHLGADKLALLEGDPGLGKSLLALDLCARVSRGLPFPDGTGGGEPGTALVLNAEDDPATVRERLAALGADLSRVFVLADLGLGLDHVRFPGHIPVLDEALTRTRARLAVIDPLLAFLDTNVASGNDQSIRRALTPLAALAARHSCAHLLVRHLNKHRGKHAIYRGGGAIGLVGACRSAWLVGRDPGVTGQCVFAQVKNNLAPPQPSLAYRIEAEADGPVRLSWLGASPWSADQVLASRMNGPARVQARAFLLSFLQNGPRLVPDIWAEAQKQSLLVRTLQRARKDLLIDSRRVRRDGRQNNYWLLPGQQLPPEAYPPVPPERDIEDLLAPLRALYPPPTPLEDDD